MNYICLDCGGVFHRPRVVEEFHGEPGRAGERQWVSPCCGAGVTIGITCTGCGRAVPEGESHHGLCPRCAQKAVGRLRGYLQKAFTDAERAILDDAFDGVALSEEPRAG